MKFWYKPVNFGVKRGGLGRKVDVRLPGKGNSNSHGARPVHLVITMIKWIRTSRLSIKNCLSGPQGSCEQKMAKLAGDPELCKERMETSIVLFEKVCVYRRYNIYIYMIIYI